MDNYEINQYTRHYTYKECLEGPPHDIICSIDPLPLNDEKATMLSRLIVVEKSIPIEYLDLMADWIIYFLRLSALKNGRHFTLCALNNDKSGFARRYDFAIDDVMKLTRKIANKIKFGLFLRNSLPIIIVGSLLFIYILVQNSHW